MTAFGALAPIQTRSREARFLAYTGPYRCPRERAGYAAKQTRNWPRISAFSYETRSFVSVYKYHVLQIAHHPPIQLAEVAMPRQMFADILSLIASLRAPPAPA